MSRDRKDIYLGDGLRRALRGRKESLSTSVNLIADRYMGVIEREARAIALPDAVERAVRGVLAETRGHRLESREIAVLPDMAADWSTRNGGAVAEGATIIAHLRARTFAQLVAIVDTMERAS